MAMWLLKLKHDVQPILRHPTLMKAHRETKLERVWRRIEFGENI